MTWNWQNTKWPNFSWKKAEISKLEQQFAYHFGGFRAVLKYVTEKDQNSLKIDFLCTEAVKTSEIEGEVLDRASVQSSIRRGFGLSHDEKKSKPKEKGISKMLVDVYQTFEENLSDKMLFPRLKNIISVGQFSSKFGLFKKNKHLVSFLLF